MAKKYSHGVKPTSQINYEESIKRMAEKPMVKYVRSATNITKPENASLLPQYQQKKEVMHYDVPNREETDPNMVHYDAKQPQYGTYTPKYGYMNTKPVEPKSMQTMHNMQPYQTMQGVPMTYSGASMSPTFNPSLNPNWKSPKNPSSAMMTSNEIK